ncbi:hypothetical protein HHI36_003080 [Cryptolaemus montrouzieri]|uniref:Chemosensory protein n=1 Tax=Cryptolaemus montrouzieri TaxID=559131 RepID=A0ABD2PCX4_9CUCU
MKYSLAALFIAACVALATAATTYTNKYDKIDLDAVIKNDRLLKSYVKCLLETGGCRPDGVELKSVLPDALQTDCEKCTEAQKIGSRKMIRHLLKNKREWWNELEVKYDPKKVYVNKYRDELLREGIVL